VQDRLGDALVHAHGRREDSGADVGDAERLEVSLDHAVLAEGAVQHREDDGTGRQQVAQLGPLGVGELLDQLVG